MEALWCPLVVYLRSYLPAADDAEDAAQEAFVRIWEFRERWGPGSAKALAYKIGRNLAYDRQRRRRVRLRREVRVGRSVFPRIDTPEEQMMGSELRERFEEALERLPTKRRRVFELIRFEGCSYREAAEVLGISTQTVANHLCMAVRDLRTSLSEFLGSSGEDGSSDRVKERWKS